MKYFKALATLAVAVAAALVVALGTTSSGDAGDISTQNWLIAALAVLGSAGLVAFVENLPEAPKIKAVVAGLSAGIGSLVIALDDNLISQAEWLTAFSAAVAGTGLVYQLANKKG